VARYSRIDNLKTVKFKFEKQTRTKYVYNRIEHILKSPGLLLSSLQQFLQRDATVDDRASKSLESVYKISCSGLGVLIFYVLLFEFVYLASCNFAIDSTKEQHQLL
jgi:hypothetical protein